MLIPFLINCISSACYYFTNHSQAVYGIYPPCLPSFAPSLSPFHMNGYLLGYKNLRVGRENYYCYKRKDCVWWSQRLHFLCSRKITIHSSRWYELQILPFQFQELVISDLQKISLLFFKRGAMQHIHQYIFQFSFLDLVIDGHPECKRLTHTFSWNSIANFLPFPPPIFLMGVSFRTLDILHQ